jgi:hypothetical protein
MSNAFDLFFGGLEVSEVSIRHINEAAKAYFQDCLNQALELKLLLPSDRTGGYRVTLSRNMSGVGQQRFQAQGNMHFERLYRIVQPASNLFN